MAARKVLKKQTLKFYFPKKILWNPFISLDRKAKEIPKSLIFAFLFCLVSFSFLAIENQKVKQKVLGAKIQLEADQKRIYEWERILTEKPDFRDGWLQLSAAYAEVGNKEKAKEALSHAKAIDPNNKVIPSLEKLLEN